MSVSPFAPWPDNYSEGKRLVLTRALFAHATQRALRPEKRSLSGRLAVRGPVSAPSAVSPGQPRRKPIRQAGPCGKTRTPSGLSRRSPQLRKHWVNGLTNELAKLVSLKLSSHPAAAHSPVFAEQRSPVREFDPTESNVNLIKNNSTTLPAQRSRSLPFPANPIPF